MSFYGSVYYQIINNFYKAIANNSGKNRTNFINKSNLESNMSFEAIGRKGTLDFDTGNRWINLSKNSDGALVIHHAPADNAIDLDTAEAFKMISQEEAGVTDPENLPNTITPLEAGSFIATDTISYDDAGHISNVQQTIYQMPVGEDKRITKLEQDVGKKEDITLSNFPGTSKVPEEKQHLYGYVEQNCKDITTLQNYTGDWSKSCNSYRVSNGKGVPNIASIIGNLDYLYSGGNNTLSYSNVASNTEKNNLAKIIGQIPKLWIGFGQEATKTSIVDAILTLKTDTETTTDQLKGTINSHTSNLEVINTNLDNLMDIVGSNVGYDTVYNEIAKLYNNDATNLQIAKDYADDIKESILGEDISATFDTLKEVESWIGSHEGFVEENVVKRIATEETNRSAGDKALSDRIDVYESEKDTYALKESTSKSISDGIKEAKDYADEKDGNTTKALQEYSDGNLGLAKDYADARKNEAIGAAQDYTNQEITKINSALEGLSTKIDNDIAAAKTDLLNGKILELERLIQELQAEINKLKNPEDPDDTEGEGQDPEVNPDTGGEGQDPENPDDTGGETQDPEVNPDDNGEEGQDPEGELSE